MENWFEEKEVSQVTVQELDALCDKCFEQKDLCDKLDDELSEAKEKLRKMQAKMVEYLNAYGKTSWKTEKGMATRKENWSVPLPQSDGDWDSFFDYLKEKNLYDTYVTVHSKSLQSLYREELEEAKRSGAVELESDFKIPGIQPATMVQTISMKRR